MTPEQAQSGAVVMANPGGRGLQLTNAGRRAAWYYVYRTGFEDDEGVVADLTPPELIAQGLLPGSESAQIPVDPLRAMLSDGVSYHPRALSEEVWVDIPGEPACCPHLSYLSEWGTVWAGALGYAFVPSAGFSFAPLHTP